MSRDLSAKTKANFYGNTLMHMQKIPSPKRLAPLCSALFVPFAGELEIEVNRTGTGYH